MINAQEIFIRARVGEIFSLFFWTHTKKGKEKEKKKRAFLFHESPSPSPTLVSTLLMLACGSSPSSASRPRFLVDASVAGGEVVACSAVCTFSIGAVVLLILPGSDVWTFSIGAVVPGSVFSAGA